MALRAWTPKRELEQMRREVDDTFDRFLGHHPRSLVADVGKPPIEAYIENNTLVIKADLPGVEAGDVEISVSGNLLTVRGRRERRREEGQHNFTRDEIAYGRFERSITIPRGIKRESIEAVFRSGVLEMVIPLATPSAQRKVPIRIGEAAPKPGKADPSAKVL